MGIIKDIVRYLCKEATISEKTLWELLRVTAEQVIENPKNVLNKVEDFM